jgi:RHS repeat-associated protein
VLEESSYIDPLNPATKQTTRRTYDAIKRVLTLTHPDTKTYEYTYSGDRVATEEDEAGSVTSYTWCKDCRGLESITRPLGFVLAWARDLDFDVKRFTDARANGTTYTYGKAGELKTTSYPDGSSEQYSYNVRTRLAKKTNARSQDETYTYDTSGRLTTTAFPTTSDPSLTYTYRADGTLLTATSQAGTTTYEYYANRLLKAEVYNFSSQGLAAIQRVEYEYFPGDLLKKITWKNGSTIVGTWEYTYDLAGKMKTVRSFNQTNTFTYDGEGKIISQLNHNGTKIETAWNDQRSWPTSITHKLAGTPFASYSLEYDGTSNTVGNLTKATELSGAVMTYGYNSLYRLTSEARTVNNVYSSSYLYDLAGNLEQVNASPFATYDAANKISSLTGGTISHDLDGNITQLTATGVPASTMTWNTQSKLKTLVSGSSTTTYTYNHRGLRAIQQQGTVKRYYIYAGDKLLGEFQGGYPQVAYTWGPDGLVSERLFRIQVIAFEAVVAGEMLEAPLSQLEDESDQSGYAVSALAPPDVMPIPLGDLTLWYHFGPQTETRYLTDETGAVTDTYLYDAYGKTIATTGTFYNPHRYGGKYGYHSNLNAAGFILAGQRWYSPHLRRWISRDPIGYRGDDNQYDYVDSNPLIFTDPTGLSPAIAVPITIGVPIAGYAAIALYCTAVPNADICKSFTRDRCSLPFFPDPNFFTEDGSDTGGHVKNPRPSNQEKHEKGDARRDRDRGGEKGDSTRRPPRKPPNGWKGKWPPQK